MPPVAHHVRAAEHVCLLLARDADAGVAHHDLDPLAVAPPRSR
jgi:hypothetical protein